MAGTQSCTLESSDGIGVLSHHLRCTAHHAPADPESGTEVALGNAAEGDAGMVSRARCQADQLHVVQDELVVDLIGHQQQIVALRDLDDGIERLGVGDRARGVVGIDDHQALGSRGDGPLDVADVRLPPVVLVERIRDTLGGELREEGGVQRVAWARHQELVAWVQQGGHGQLDGLTRAGREEDMVGIVDALRCRLPGDRIDRLHRSLGGSIAVVSSLH